MLSLGGIRTWAGKRGGVLAPPLDGVVLAFLPVGGGASFPVGGGTFGAVGPLVGAAEE